MDVEIDREQYEAVAKQVGEVVRDLVDSLPPDEALLGVYELATQLLEGLTRDLTCACIAGCSHCCHQSVDVTPFEVAALVKFIGTMPSGPRRVALAGLRKLASVPLETRRARGSAKTNRCSFLGRDGRCQVYEVRPLNCRFYSSMSEADCRRKLADNSFEFKGAAAPMLAMTLVESAIGSALVLHYGPEAVEKNEMVLAALEALDKAGQ